MYVPEHFAETNVNEIRRIIDQYPLGTLVTFGADGLDANQIPFDSEQFDGQSGVLRAHVARANPIWKEVNRDSEVLVVFRAVDAYISPNWFPSKFETHRLVPTWNYQVVNVYGKIRFIEEEKFLRSVVARLTRDHENRNEKDKAWRMGDAPPDYLSAMLQAIVGIEITVARVVAKSKLSQNREVRDRRSAAEALNARGHQELSALMSRD